MGGLGGSKRVFEHAPPIIRKQWERRINSDSIVGGGRAPARDWRRRGRCTGVAIGTRSRERKLEGPGNGLGGELSFSVSDVYQ